MNKKLQSFFLVLGLSGLMLFNSCSPDNDGESYTIAPLPVFKPNIVFYGLTNSNQLVKLNANAPGTVISTTTITGLGSEKIIAIDFRPATGQLYGLGASSHLYVINPETGSSLIVNPIAFTPALSGPMAGFDFNPTVDRIRIVTYQGQNLRVNPETGTTVAVDGSINPTANIAGSAYTNSFSGATTTTLFNIDFVNRNLFIQNPPNTGTVAIVGGGFQLASSTVDGGFDISPDNTVALASYNYLGTAGLMRVDLVTGLTTDMGSLSTPIIGLAIPTVPVAYSIENNNNTNNLLIFNLQVPVIPISKNITGLQPNEKILGIDMRPATGQLYAIGSTSRLYAINMGSGAATVVGPVFSTLLNGTSFGFDFNPTVDRIRVVSNTGQNLRLNPITGDIAAVDVALNPGVPNVAAAAYTNNFGGATTTTLFVIDHTTGILYQQIPPNNGTLLPVGSLGVTLSPENGFDIGGVSGKAYAFFNTGSTNKIYTINLTTGAATEFTTIPATTRAFCVGLGL